MWFNLIVYFLAFVGLIAILDKVTDSYMKRRNRRFKIR